MGGLKVCQKGMPLIITPGHLKKRGEFYMQLATFTRAGVGVVQGLQVMAQRPPAASYRKPIESILQGLGMGFSFAECLDRLGDWAPEFDRTLFNAGERSGRLDEVLRVLATYYAERAELASKAMSAMTYPIFLVHMAGVIFPPSLLGKLVWEGDVAGFASQKLLFFAPLYLGGFLLVFLAQKAQASVLRSVFERVTSLIPYVAGSRKDNSIARFALALEAMINAGVPMIEALMTSASASGSMALEKAVHANAGRLAAGDTPSEVICRIKYFPDLFASSFKAGELSGQLDSTLKRMQHMYQEQAALKAKAVAEWVPRLIYLCVAAAIGYFIFNFWTNYYGNLMSGF